MPTFLIVLGLGIVAVGIWAVERSAFGAWSFLVFLLCLALGPVVAYRGFLMEIGIRGKDERLRADLAQRSPIVQSRSMHSGLWLSVVLIAAGLVSLWHSVGLGGSRRLLAALMGVMLVVGGTSRIILGLRGRPKRD